MSVGVDWIPHNMRFSLLFTFLWNAKRVRRILLEIHKRCINNSSIHINSSPWVMHYKLDETSATLTLESEEMNWTLRASRAAERPWAHPSRQSSYSLYPKSRCQHKQTIFSESATSAETDWPTLTATLFLLHAERQCYNAISSEHTILQMKNETTCSFNTTLSKHFQLLLKWQCMMINHFRSNSLFVKNVIFHLPFSYMRPYF